MPQPSDITIIVCTRNRAAMLTEALSAIAAASPPEAEVLVVDSASDTDDTRRVAEAAGVAYVRAGKGLSVARNAGITSAARPLVVFTDDDCRPTVGWIERLLACFEDPGVAAATGRMLDHTLTADAPYSRPARYTTPLSGLDAGHGAVMAFRREVLLRLGGFDDLMGAGQKHAGAEDLDIFIRILRAGPDVVHDGKCVVLHANTRVGDAYVDLHRGYGLGLGALVGKWLRLDPVFGIRMGWTLTRRTAARIARSRRRGGSAAHERAMVQGLISGVIDVRRIPLVGERFVPPWSPQRVPVLRAEGVVS
ncbi:glycosyltransferase family 2 protein [Microbacterium thalassium]|uniref:Glycosyltransferase involved in cell wall biosynthesis n=1 Tax=Microbacterium thalassium TaxID=362649 RepID=A0A7X0KTN0_9MICO|nr:glycosyltransferase family A protein [Microbacterium thalassium]MBB6390259.1 glycosyltransferase involved in cell wall biosynthesis [Microbacterium thalassium]GLK25368.1 glycosyl transferase [Microbacterium thalassium]